MNGADCGACGYITCQCDRIKQEKEESKVNEINRMKDQLKAKEAALGLLSQWLSDARRGRHVCSDMSTLDKVEQTLKGEKP